VSDATKPRGYLDKYGAKLIANGYDIIPIRRGSKAPALEEGKWQTVRADKDTLGRWLEGKYTRCGVGILAKHTPAVDIDVLDEEMAVALEDFVRARCGAAPLRIGMAPKRLMLFRTDAPFRKINSNTYEDEWADPGESGKGHLRKVEILGDGQQFVSFHVHPETGKPFEWFGGSPATIRRKDLPLLTEEDGRAIVAEFERLAQARGWEIKKSARALSRPAGALTGGVIDKNDVFAADAAKVTDLTEDEIHAKLLLVPGAEDYDTWLQIGMALFHQFDGSDRGLELWHEWSATVTNYDADSLDSKWASFDISDKGRAPVTARLIIKLAAEEAEKIATETFRDISEELRNCNDLPTLRVVCAKVKTIEFDAFARAQIVGMVQKRFKEIAGSALTISTARDMVRYENPDPKELPRWLENWVYIGSTNSFYTTERRIELGVDPFNAVHGRHMLTKKDVLEGKSVPETAASHFALHNKQIPIVQRAMYLPGEENLFWHNSVPCVNTYSDRNVPAVPEKLNSAEREAIRRIEAHYEHLIEDARERELLKDAMAYIVQNPGKRLNWAILIQGTEGDGKSFFAGLLAAALGGDNVRTPAAQLLEDKFNGWSEGAQVVFFEEIKLHGHNRYDVLNKVKPLITNPQISVRRMQTDAYDAINTATYILTTNFRDALPLDENDTRYFVIFSRWQSEHELSVFTQKNDDYYENLYGTLQHGGAIRKWFLEREFSPEFSPTRRAPKSRAKSEMVKNNRSNESEALDELLEEGTNPLISKTLLVSSALAEEFADRGCDSLYGQAMNKFLDKHGFVRLKKVRIGGGSPEMVYSRVPNKFKTDGEPDHRKIQAWLEPDL
jgi:hypothetical protein